VGVGGKNKITNEDVLIRIGKIRTLFILFGRDRLGHIVRYDNLVKLVIEGKIAGKRARGRRGIAILDDVKNGASYTLPNKDAKDLRVWRNKLLYLEGPATQKNTIINSITSSHQ